ncbi:MAG: hypothetical protein PVG78_00980 [Desulfobacterales bacterium]
MIDKGALCEKIRAIYPDVGACGIDVRAEYDGNENAWVIYLQKGNREVKHFLPPEDAEACMGGKQCVSLGIEIAQFKDYERAPER